MSEQDSLWRHEVTIPSDPKVGSGVVEGLLDAMRRSDWPDYDQFRVQLAYEEAIANAILHGNQCAEDKTVHVRMCCDAEEVLIEITDMGCGFDPCSLPDPRDDEHLEVLGGRGVLLMRELMSHVEFNPTGNRVRMRKHRGDSPAPQVPEDEISRED